MNKLQAASLFGVLVTLLCAAANAAEDTSAQEDSLSWLETIEGDRVNSWVNAENERTFADFTRTKSFAALQAKLLAAYDASDRIPQTFEKAGYRYNFWKDSDSPRGILRRTTEASYRGKTPEWELVLDLDALATRENENWVYKGNIRNPGIEDRVLIALSRGGADATVVREFDLKQKTFVAGGFFLPEAKSRVAWYDQNTLLVATDSGPESLTESGYPRQIRKWQRGQSLADAPIWFEGSREDVSVFVTTDLSPQSHHVLVVRSLNFFDAEYHIEINGKLTQLKLPKQLDLKIHNKRLYFSPKKDWQLNGVTYPAGSLLTSSVRELGAGPTEMIYAPAKGRSLAQFVLTKDHLIINELANVTNRLYLAKHEEKWSLQPISDNGGLARRSVRSVNPHDNNVYETTVTGFLTPQTLVAKDAGQNNILYQKSLAPKFEDRGLTVEQMWVTSRDGTRVPYFQIGPEKPENKPTILYGYGGFEVSLAPFYSATVGNAWLTQGNVYVVANIRGGGEFGPAWHQAALRENRLRAYEDFIAVAEDLIARGVTSNKRLGTTGGSNGGLLVGNMLTMRPDLFGAVVSQVPLLDMRRYNKLLAGASWEAEYGNPDDPDDWAFMEAFSPYHNLAPRKVYPPTLFTTSTRDDRVHPGHARKMAAKMSAMGKAVYLYENTEGGHAGAANNDQVAFNNALVYEFFRQQLD